MFYIFFYISEYFGIASAKDLTPDICLQQHSDERNSYFTVGVVRNVMASLFLTKREKNTRNIPELRIIVPRAKWGIILHIRLSTAAPYSPALVRQPPSTGPMLHQSLGLYTGYI